MTYMYERILTVIAEKLWGKNSAVFKDVFFKKKVRFAVLSNGPEPLLDKTHGQPAGAVERFHHKVE